MLLPDQLIEYSCEDPEHPRTTILRSATNSQLGGFLGMCSTREGGLWLTGIYGLAKHPDRVRNLGRDTTWKEYSVPASLGSSVCRTPMKTKAAP